MPVPGESGHIEAHNKWNEFVQDARNGKVSELVGPRGPVGSRGPVGPEGPQGLQGEKGDQGPIGPTGNQGPEGPQGIQGPQGPRGQGITLKGVYDTLQSLKQAHPTGKVGDAYFVKDTESLYVWDGQTQAWVDAGSIEGPQGPQGPQGVEGPAGPTGPQGPQGATGETGPRGPAGKDGVASATYPVEYDENTRDVSLNPLLGMVQVQPINDDVGPGLTVRSGDVDSVVNEGLGVVHDAARIAFEHNKSGYDGWVTKYTNRLSINSSDRVCLGVGDDVATALEVVSGNDVNVRNDLTVQGDVAASTVHADGQDVGAALNDLQSNKAPVVNPTLMGSVSLPETTEYAGEQLSDRFAAKLDDVLTTKGDLVTYGTGVQRIGVGSDDQVLTASSGTPSGLQWKTPEASDVSLIDTTSFSAVSSLAVNSVFSADYSTYRLIVVMDLSSQVELRMRLRAGGSGASGSDYFYALNAVDYTGSAANSGQAAITYWVVGQSTGLNGEPLIIDITRPFATTETHFSGFTSGRHASTNGKGWVAGHHNLGSLYDGYSLFPQSGTFSGVAKLYGYK